MIKVIQRETRQNVLVAKRTLNASDWAAHSVVLNVKEHTWTRKGRNQTSGKSNFAFP